MNDTAATYDFLGPPLEPGDIGTLGSYRILGELGKGGMGYVFRAEDTVLKRAVALKVMNKKIAMTANSRDRFIEEARAMAAVHHDNVVVIFEVGQRNGTPFMAMEMLKGETLEAVNLRKEQLGFEQIIDFATQIARGLGAAHQKGIVHRDIKPANIWIEERTNRIKILDFGLALAQTPVDRMSSLGSVIGTPAYLAPEQARSDPLDDRSDLYSLGVVLYELCAGRRPFAAATLPQQLVAILSHDPPPIRDFNPNIPAPLADMVLQLLQKEPQDRPASAESLEILLAEVARQCEAKSEVALSINKLQESLKEVVSKQSSVAEPDFVVPAARNNAPQATAGSFNDLSSFQLPTAAAPSPIVRPVPARPLRPQPSPVDWRAFAPWIGGGIALLIAIPAILYFVFFAGASAPTRTVDVPKPSVESPVNPLPVEPAPAPIADKPKPKPKPVPPVAKPQPPKRKPDPEPVVVPETMPDPQPEITPEPDPKPEPVAPPEYEVFTIRTTQGIGADSSVRRGINRESLGLSSTIAVQMRGGVEIQHGYMRFDLGSIKDSKNRIKRIALVLTMPEKETPHDASLRLYGIDNDLAALWQESGSRGIVWNNSVSRIGLQALPVLAEFDPKTLKVNNQHINISTKELTDFVRSASGKSVTFVIAGGQTDETPLSFFSREGDPENAPALAFQIEPK